MVQRYWRVYQTNVSKSGLGKFSRHFSDIYGQLLNKEWRLHGHKRAKRSYSTFKVRKGGCEEIPLGKGKEQWLCFAGAAVKIYPTSKVRKT